ncbi:MAG: NAD(P)H-dependent oxidoreductase subunit E [Candidatus Marinimicrobia bacterium]|nr:NAD(P)H-dependent oxidoreductase subunit E [Candidatus Neomarinimicrobiota bacterium]
MSAPNTAFKNLEKERSNLIKALQQVQGIEGYISDMAVHSISDYFSIPPVEVEGVLSFYAQFKRIKPGKNIITVCDGTACHIKGSSLVANWISDFLGIKDKETDKKGLFSLETVACLGCCSLAPVIGINGKIFGNLDRRKLLKVLKQYKQMG